MSLNDNENTVNDRIQSVYKCPLINKSYSTKSLPRFLILSQGRGSGHVNKNLTLSHHLQMG